MDVNGGEPHRGQQGYERIFGRSVSLLCQSKKIFGNTLLDETLLANYFCLIEPELRRRNSSRENIGSRSDVASSPRALPASNRFEVLYGDQFLQELSINTVLRPEYW